MIPLEELLSQIPQEDYPKQSRIHKLPFLSCEKKKWFIKREDELGFFTSGCKVRKWRTLIPALVLDQVESAILIGSANSSNVLGLTLLLLEKGIKPLPLLLKPSSDIQGNRLFIELSLRQTKPIFVERKDWPEVETIAASLKESMSTKTAIIPEGSNTKDAFFGALTLALDVVRNEKEQKISFDHIFIDAGTGLQAAALILGLGSMGHKAKLSVLLLDEDHDKFQKTLRHWQSVLKSDHPLNYQTFVPKGQRGFRPLSESGFKKIVEFARDSGVWTDPLYSGRLITEAPLEAAYFEGNILLIHTGGLNSLFGFNDTLRKIHSG